MSMLKFLKLCVVAACLGCATAHASTSTSEITDMWWNPDESGWGVNVVLQNDVAFLTFFVYDAAMNPVWYTSSARFDTSTFAFTGDLSATKGPWFGGPFSTSNVTVRKAGTVSFVLTDLNRATLTYTVDGVTATRTVQRQTWTLEDYSGNYLGGYSFRDTGCTPTSLNGIEEAGGILTVNHDGASLAVTLSTSVGACSFAGTYTQTGKLGQVAGNFTCTNGAQGPFLMFELTPTISGFTGRVTGQNQFCQFDGYMGGVRRSP